MKNDAPLPVAIQRQWRNPTGWTAVFVAGGIGVMIGLVTWLVYAGGGTVFAWLHLMYIPIILAAAFFQVPGGMIAALAAGAALGPLMPLSVAKGIAQQPMNWVFRVCFFTLVGLVTGQITRWLNAQIDKAERAAYIDSLTALPTMIAMERMFNQKIDQGRLSLAVISFSNLTEIITTLGYKCRPHLMLQIADRLRQGAAGTPLFRLTDRTFAILSAEPDLDTFIAMCQRVTTSLKEPFFYNYVPVALNMHIGVAQRQEDDPASMTTLVQRARVALFSAREENKLCKTYDPADDHMNVERLALLGSLHSAIEQSELSLFLQPKIKIDSRRVSGAETLIRWNHPEKGLVRPDLFIPEAERTWIIHPLTLFAMRTVLRQIKHFEDKGWDLRLAVNLTAQSIQDKELIGEFIDMIRDSGIDPQHLEVEITERILVTDLATASSVLHSLKDLGARISVDDFGAGHSTMRYVRDLPIDAIKIDQSLITNLITSEFSRIVVDHIFQIAQKMDLVTIAEGVETEEILAKLKEFGCDYAQGYLISKPLPENEFEQWLADCQWAEPEPCGCGCAAGDQPKEKAASSV